MTTIESVVFLGFLINIVKGMIALGAAWGFLRLADWSMGIDFNSKINNLDGLGFAIFAGARWLAIAIILHVIFL